VPDLLARAQSTTLPLPDRRLALDTLAFTDAPAASQAMLTMAEPASPHREMATWWLLNRLSNSWVDHNLLPALKTAGIYDPESIALQQIVVPEAPADLPVLAIDEVVRLTGDAQRGSATANRCLVCHTIGGAGVELGPALDGWGRGKSAEVIATSIVQPNADIAQGFGGFEVQTKDGLTIQGLQIKQGDPLMMRSMGGVTQIIPADRVATRRPMQRSLMMSAAQLGLTAQDVADLVAFLRSE
jgi:putative heme-binding domain-containing protein